MTEHNIAGLLAHSLTDLFNNGEFRPSVSGERFNVLNPATSEVLTTVASATPEKDIEALDAAVAAHEAWGQPLPGCVQTFSAKPLNWRPRSTAMIWP